MQKTKKAIRKRFKTTGTGKLIRRKPNHRHLLRKKSKKQRRSANKDQSVSEGMSVYLKKGLPYN